MKGNAWMHRTQRAGFRTLAEDESEVGNEGEELTRMAAQFPLSLLKVTQGQPMVREEKIGDAGEAAGDGSLTRRLRLACRARDSWWRRKTEKPSMDTWINVTPG